MQATRNIRRTQTQTRSRVAARRETQVIESRSSNCKVCADTYGRLVTALARFQTVGRIAAMSGEDPLCVHDRLAGVEAISPVSWKAMSRVATRLKLATAPGECPGCGAGVVWPVRTGERTADLQSAAV
jgi:hypothetical protein